MACCPEETTDPHQKSASSSSSSQLSSPSLSSEPAAEPCSSSTPLRRCLRQSKKSDAPSDASFDAPSTPIKVVKQRRYPRRTPDTRSTDRKTRSCAQTSPLAITPISQARARRKPSTLALPPSPESLPRPRPRRAKQLVIETEEPPPTAESTVIAPSETGVVEAVGKILLIQGIPPSRSSRIVADARRERSTRSLADVGGDEPVE